jgi:hypothetical protein
MILTLPNISANKTVVKPDVKNGMPFEYTPAEGSVEELYKDIIASLIAEPIINSISQYYGSPHGYDLWDMKFLQIERPLGYRSFTFVIKVQVRPFVGSHNTIGIDIITIRVQGSKPTVEKFEHVKSYPIPVN